MDSSLLAVNLDARISKMPFLVLCLYCSFSTGVQPSLGISYCLIYRPFVIKLLEEDIGIPYCPERFFFTYCLLPSKIAFGLPSFEISRFVTRGYRVWLRIGDSSIVLLGKSGDVIRVFWRKSLLYKALRFPFFLDGLP